MIISKLKDYQNVQKAIDYLNKNGYDDNVKIHYDGMISLNHKGTRVRLRLQVKKLDKPGHRRHLNMLPYTGQSKRSTNACWHTHGHFFEALLALEPTVQIRPAGGLLINSKGGNWQDRNIGSLVHPVMFSESCDCNK